MPSPSAQSSWKRPKAHIEKPRDPIDRPLERRPRGYHKLAERIMGPYPEMAIFRRFGDLNMLRLLSLQAELLDLQLRFRQATAGDEISSEKAREYSTSFVAMLDHPEAERPEQWRLLVDIRKKVDEYNDALLQTAEVTALSKPSRKNKEILREWLDEAEDCRDEGGNRVPFMNGAEFYTWDEAYDKDLVAVSPAAESDPFTKAISSDVLDLYNALWGHKRKKRRVVDDDTGIVEYSDNIAFRISKGIASVVSAMLPLIAVIVLYFVHPIETRIWVMIALTAAFAIAITLLTSAKNHEIFVATAGFAAVEVVFIGTVPSTNIPGLTHGAIAGISISSGVIALTILLTVTAHLYKQKTRRDKERRHREAAERVEKLKRPSPANTSSWPSESMA